MRRYWNGVPRERCAGRSFLPRNSLGRSVDPWRRSRDCLGRRGSSPIRWRNRWPRHPARASWVPKRPAASPTCCSCSPGAPTAMGVTEIARELGLSKAVVHRILQSLSTRSLVRADPTTRSTGWGPARSLWAPGDAGLRPASGSPADAAADARHHERDHDTYRPPAGFSDLPRSVREPAGNQDDGRAGSAVSALRRSLQPGGFWPSSPTKTVDRIIQMGLDRSRRRPFAIRGSCAAA
jgi:hypothetical protein